MMSKRWVVLMITVAGLSLSGQAADRYVSLSGSHTPPYTNWAMAATNIETAAGVALASETVWVTNGTYTLTNQITIANSITVKGVNGYSNTFVNGNYAAVTTRCFYVSGAHASLVGLTISNGYAVGASGDGGGVYLTSSVLGTALVSCAISGNTAGRHGGGVYRQALYSGDYRPLIRDCVFRGNRANSEGGGIYVSCNAFVSNCVFEANQAATYGGGGLFSMRCKVQDCTFTNNRAVSGGACGFSAVNNNITNLMVRSRLLNNRATEGGGVWGNNVNCLIGIDCLIRGNTASRGGAVYTTGGGPHLLHCTIRDNCATNGSGGGIYFSGGFGTLRNCLVMGNDAYGNYNVGGGVVVLNYGAGNALIESCTIVGNKIRTSQNNGNGGGLAIAGNNAGARVQVLNSIVVSNAAPQRPAAEWNWAITASPVPYIGFTNSCTVPSVNAYGTGNITNGPLFEMPGSGYGTDFVAGNYRLGEESPCVDTGTNQWWMAAATDLDIELANPRIQRGRVGDIVDIGAYERPPPPPPTGTVILVR